MQLWIVTGMSGSGKSSVMDVMEDIGYYCIDNIPPVLIGKFVSLCSRAENKIDKIAVAIDIRSGDMFSEIYNSIEKMKLMPDVDVRILFIEADDETLIKRYKETRRKHPLDEKFNGNLHGAIAGERSQLIQLKGAADYYIETTGLSVSQLKEQVKKIMLERTSDSLVVKVTTFGFKYGVSTESDLVFDVRCLPNPYYDKELRSHTGCEQCVQDYVMNSENSQELYKKITDLLDFLLPLYVAEGKSQLVVSFGCTGGKHRSVTFAELTTKHLEEKGYHVRKFHRDIKKDRN